MSIIEPETRHKSEAVSRTKKVATVIALAAVLCLPLLAYALAELFG